MKQQILVLTFGLLVNLTIAQQAVKKQPSTEFDKILTEQFRPGDPGATALISHNGEIIYKNAIGMANMELNVPMQVDNVFRIGSITKQFTAIAILQLMEQGKLTLQDEITKFIPDYPTQGYKITVEHLLTHTSGIRSYTSMPDYVDRMTQDLKPTEMIDHFKNEPMDFAPGTQWNYSNSGYFLLGYIIEVVTGKTYAEYLEENFFGPLGMTNSYISLIASTIYVIVWALEYKFIFPDFLDHYSSITIAKVQASGAGPAEIAEELQQLATYRDMYKNPIWFTLITYAQYLPGGLITSLIAAFILKKGNRKNLAVAS